MKYVSQILRLIDRITDIGMMVFILMFLLMGTYAAYDSYMLYSETDDESLLRFKPDYEKKEDGKDDRQITDDMAAWLTITGTDIDYPVMQGEDNEEYLNRNPYGEYSPAGSIFLDFRNAGDFTDPYSLIYGHHMDQSLMFGALDQYLEEGYLEDHRWGTLTVGEKTYEVRLFAVLETDSMNPYVFSPTESDDETYPFVKEHAVYFDEEAALKKGERLLALSTCKYPDPTARIIVFGAFGGMKQDEAAS